MIPTEVRVAGREDTGSLHVRSRSGERRTGHRIAARREAPNIAPFCAKYRGAANLAIITNQ